MGKRIHCPMFDQCWNDFGLFIDKISIFFYVFNVHKILLRLLTRRKFCLTLEKIFKLLWVRIAPKEWIFKPLLLFEPSCKSFLKNLLAFFRRCKMFKRSFFFHLFLTVEKNNLELFVKCNFSLLFYQNFKVCKFFSVQQSRGKISYKYTPWFFTTESTDIARSSVHKILLAKFYLWEVTQFINVFHWDTLDSLRSDQYFYS